MTKLIKTEKESKESIVYVLQELPGTRIGRPKYNIIGAQKYGKLKAMRYRFFNEV